MNGSLQGTVYLKYAPSMQDAVINIREVALKNYYCAYLIHNKLSVHDNWGEHCKFFLKNEDGLTQTAFHTRV